MQVESTEVDRGDRPGNSSGHHRPSAGHEDIDQACELLSADDVDHGVDAARVDRAHRGDHVPARHGAVDGLRCPSLLAQGRLGPAR